jgi:hypothetical protein
MCQMNALEIKNSEIYQTACTLKAALCSFNLLQKIYSIFMINLTKKLRKKTELAFKNFSLL